MFPRYLLPPSSLIALTMQAASTSEMSVNFYQTAQSYNPKTAIFILAAMRTSNPAYLANYIRVRPRVFEEP
jgi:hypothetical protein